MHIIVSREHHRLYALYDILSAFPTHPLVKLFPDIFGN